MRTLNRSRISDSRNTVNHKDAISSNDDGAIHVRNFREVRKFSNVLPYWDLYLFTVEEEGASEGCCIEHDFTPFCESCNLQICVRIVAGPFNAPAIEQLGQLRSYGRLTFLRCCLSAT